MHKTLLTALLAGVLAFNISACSRNDSIQTFTGTIPAALSNAEVQ